ncbi:MAG: DNA polymerase I [Candidatus Hydrogenedentes bacterium]|nr:DNA polymerase I [Candidatus Hydrogenedentota bacterium]
MSCKRGRAVADRLFLIDGSAFAYRSFFAIRNLTNSMGQPTNAVFGFARILLKILREHEPSHVAVVFDAPGKTFRHEKYPEYKATRAATPDDLISQLPLIDRVVEAFNIPLVRVAGVEADDVMGTLARRAEEAGMDAVLVTGDKDLLQLITEHVRGFDPNKGANGTWFGEEEVRERFGTAPERVPDALGLMGDTSDNVPGVRGIGEKTARGLLERYGSLEGVYEHLDELKGKQRERLETDKAMAFLSRELVTIDREVDVALPLDACRRQAFDREKVADVFSELEFQSLLEEFAPDAAAAEDTEYVLVVDRAVLDRALAEMRAAGRFAVDTETTSTDPMQADLVGISMSCRAGTGYYVPVGHTAGSDDLLGESGAGDAQPTQLPLDQVLEAVRPLFEDAEIEKIGHNIKYDLVVLERAGVRLAGIGLDTMVCSYLTDPSRVRHNLNDVSLHYLKRKLIPISDLIGTGAKAVTFDTVPVEKACTYACEDADIAWRLAEVFEPLLRDHGLDALYREVELPLIGVLARMEQAGVAIDLDVFRELREEIEGRVEALTAQIFETAGEPFQINSPKQLQEILFGKLGLKPVRRTKTGYSTDVEVLEQLAVQHPLPELILEYRSLEKLRGTYVDALPKLVNPTTGRIHTSFNQAVAATGRLSSSDPNLQNIPVRTDIGRRIRQGFVPGSPDRKLISADYSQIELRILAHLSGDEALTEAFHQDADIHQDTAARVFGVLPETVSSEMRRQAKAVNFGVVYGISAFGLARNLRISQQAAARFIEQYFAQYPGVRRFLDETIERAKRDGYVTTLLNRRRYVPELNASNVNARRAAERVAINTPVQGSAADVIKLAMIRLDRALDDADESARLLLQVHDELLVEAPAVRAEEVAATMKAIMEEAIPLDVPLKVDAGIGNHWAEIH